MTKLTTLVGMNNPHSADPRFALAPHPRGVAGHNLWRMTNEVCGVPRAQYMRTLHRINLCVGEDYDPTAARDAAEKLWPMLEGTRVILLGDAVRKSCWLPKLELFNWYERDGVKWCQLPHPSGLNRLYNDPLVRLAAGLRLEREVARGCAVLGEEMAEEELKMELDGLGDG